MCLHGTLSSFHFNSLSNTRTFRKKMFWPLDPATGAEGVFKDRLSACLVLYASFL